MVVIVLLMKLVSEWYLFMKWFMFRISVMLVIGIFGIMVRVVVRVMKLVLVILVVFLELSMVISSRVIWWFRVSLVLVVWVMNSVVRVMQMLVLFRLNEQLVGIIRFIIDLLQLVCFIFFISDGSVDFDEDVLSISSSLVFRQCVSLNIEKLYRWQIILRIIVMNRKVVRQNELISQVRLISELMLYLLMVKVIVLKVLIGVVFIRICISLNIGVISVFRKFSIGLFFLFIIVSVMLNSMVMNSICRMLLLIKVLSSVFGMMFIRKLIRVRLCDFLMQLCIVVWFSLVGLMFMFVLGCIMCVMIMLMISVSVEKNRKYVIVLVNMWFIVCRWVMLVMLVMMVRKIIGVMIIFIRLMKVLLSGFIFLLISGLQWLRMVFRMIVMIIWKYSW